MDWYQGTVGKEQILRITFGESYEAKPGDEGWRIEKWQAFGWLHEREVFVCGGPIGLHSRLFAGFQGLQEIIGLSVLTFHSRLP